MKKNLTALQQLTALAASQKPANRPSKDAKVGDRVKWDGDMANDPHAGKIDRIEGAFMWIQWDDGGKAHACPLGLLDGPRWHLL